VCVFWRDVREDMCKQMENHVEKLRSAQNNFNKLSKKPGTIDDYEAEVRTWKDHIVEFKAAARRAHAVLRSDRPQDARKQKGNTGKGKKRKRGSKRASSSSSTSGSDS
jgi:hypothetical protein